MLDRVIGGPLDLPTVGAAAGISEIVDENMANAARVHAIECGKDLGRRTLIAFGGAAPLHASRPSGKARGRPDRDSNRRRRGLGDRLSACADRL